MATESKARAAKIASELVAKKKKLAAIAKQKLLEAEKSRLLEEKRRQAALAAEKAETDKIAGITI